MHESQRQFRSGPLAALLVMAALAQACDRGSKKPSETPPTPAAVVTPPAGTGGSAAGPAAPASGKACASDVDCRLVADYCTGCDCRPLAADAPNPACAGPGVRCLADPCLNKKAACDKGRCVAADAAKGAAAPGSYDPCAGKKCGDACKVCPPGDATCLETMEVKQCNAAGKCSPLDPACPP